MSTARPIRCLQLSKFYFPQLGGIESVAFELTEGLLHRGFEVEVLCANTKRRTITEHMPYKVTRSASLGTLLSTSISPVMLAHVAHRKHSYDIIHVHLPNPMTNLALFLANPRAKVVVHWHNDVVSQQRALKLYQPLQRWLLERADAIIATTSAYADSSPWLRPFAEKIRIVPIGIKDLHLCEESRISEAVNSMRQRYGNARIVFALGRMTHYKGFDVLVRAVRRLPRDVQVVVGGGGQMAGALSALARSEGVAERVHFVGPLDREQVLVYHRAADVFCLPSTSRAESFGVVLLEAMSAKRPIVATRIEGSGVTWVAPHGVTGLNVTVGDPNELALALMSILDDATAAARYGSAARKRFEDLFTAERMVNATADLYRELITI